MILDVFTWSPVLYAFEVAPDGRPVREVAASAEIFPERVDTDTEGRPWTPCGIEALQERDDYPAQVFLATLEKSVAGWCYVTYIRYTTLNAREPNDREDLHPHDLRRAVR